MSKMRLALQATRKPDLNIEIVRVSFK